MDVKTVKQFMRIWHMCTSMYKKVFLLLQKLLSIFISNKPYQFRDQRIFIACIFKANTRKRKNTYVCRKSVVARVIHSQHNWSDQDWKLDKGNMKHSQCLDTITHTHTVLNTSTLCAIHFLQRVQYLNALTQCISSLHPSQRNGLHFTHRQH